MLSIHAEVQHFGDEDETNYDTDERNKENKNEFWIFIDDRKSEKCITYNKINKQTLCKFWSKEKRVVRSKICAFFLSKTFAKKKNGVLYKPATLTYFQLSIQQHLNPKNSMVNLQRDDCFKLLNFLGRFFKSWWKYYWSNAVKFIILKPPEKWERLNWRTVSPKYSLVTKNK